MEPPGAGRIRSGGELSFAPVYRQLQVGFNAQLDGLTRENPA
jgi:hypothetical protein